MGYDSSAVDVIGLDAHRLARHPVEAGEVAGRRLHEQLPAEARERVASGRGSGDLDALVGE
ncbi:hypothetical protein [Blastococcus sp. SYSU DS0533]